MKISKTEENANKLIITFENNIFSIKFYQNPICFWLSGSKNENIASAFSLMFLNYLNNFSNSCKKLIKQKK